MRRSSQRRRNRVFQTQQPAHNQRAICPRTRLRRRQTVPSGLNGPQNLVIVLFRRVGRVGHNAVVDVAHVALERLALGHVNARLRVFWVQVFAVDHASIVTFVA